MPIVPKRVVVCEEQECEAHMMGDYVGVCWNIRMVKEPIEHQGRKVVVSVPHRSDKCYIDFKRIRESSEGEAYFDDDSSVAGGISGKAAAAISYELQLALSYIKENGL